MTIRKLWDDDDIRDSENFLRTGQFNDVVRNAPEGTTGGDSDFSTLNRCTSSFQCPAGYGCVGGVCTRINFSGSGGSGQSNSPGNCDTGSPYPNDPCNSGGPSSCSTTPSCENNPSNPRPEECCNRTRCCSYGSLSSLTPGVNCYCGECPPYPDDGKRCSLFCDGYEAATGETSTMGCSADNSCGICQECDFFSRRCKQKENGPCFCEGSECSVCAKCDSNPNSGDFGLCLYLAGLCSNCVTCPAKDCPCGGIPAQTYCNKVGPGGAGSATGSVILVADLENICSPRQCEPASSCDDKCKGVCQYKTYCDDTTGPAPACPPNTNCGDLGSLSAGGTNCTFREECDVSNLPPECERCDCNCNNDCPPCQLCGADGLCYDDPECAFCGEGQKVCPDLETCCDESETCVPVYSNVFQVGADGTTTTYASVGGPAITYIQPANGDTPYCENRSDTRDTLVITNAWTTNLNVCQYPDGVERKVAFRDSQCFGSGTNREDISPYEPVLIDSFIRDHTCCQL